MTLSWLLLSFQGRIGRKAYWFSTAILIAAELVASIVDWAAFRSSDGVVSAVVSLGMIYPGFAVTAKRWHDRDKSGWWSLIALVPVVGAVWMLVETGFLRGSDGPNRFGFQPSA